MYALQSAAQSNNINAICPYKSPRHPCLVTSCRCNNVQVHAEQAGRPYPYCTPSPQHYLQGRCMYGKFRTPIFFFFLKKNTHTHTQRLLSTRARGKTTESITFQSYHIYYVFNNLLQIYCIPVVSACFLRILIVVTL